MSIESTTGVLPMHELLRQLRHERNESQAAVGRAVGVSGGFIGQLERREKLPSLPNAIKLARHFGVPVETFAAGVEREQVQA